MSSAKELMINGKALSLLRVVDLRVELDRRGLSKSGTKKELVERLRANILKKATKSPRSATTDDEQPSQDHSTASTTSSVKSFPALPATPPKSESVRSFEQQEVITGVYGLLYMERYNSFIQGKWPHLDRQHPYNPHNLAMAGLIFLSLTPNPKTRCFVCYRDMDCSNEDFDPWLQHIQANSECPYVKLGYPCGPDDCTISDALNLCEASWTNKFAKLSAYCDQFVLESFRKITGVENGVD